MLREISYCISDYLNSRKPANKMDEFMDRYVNYDRLTKLYAYPRFEQESQFLRMRYPNGKFIITYTNFRNFQYVNDAFGYKKVVDQYEIPHKYIEFEITESVFMQDVSLLDEFLIKLRNAGFDISMDDFGSGYSSLNILPEMPVSIIKLDRDFWGARETG